MVMVSLLAAPVVPAALVTTATGAAAVGAAVAAGAAPAGAVVGAAVAAAGGAALAAAGAAGALVAAAGAAVPAAPCDPPHAASTPTAKPPRARVPRKCRLVARLPRGDCEYGMAAHLIALDVGVPDAAVGCARHIHAAATVVYYAAQACRQGATGYTHGLHRVAKRIPQTRN